MEFEEQIQQRRFRKDRRPAQDSGTDEREVPARTPHANHEDTESDAESVFTNQLEGCIAAVEAIPADRLPHWLGVIERLRAAALRRLVQPDRVERCPSPPNTEDRLLRVEEAAKILNVPKRWIYDRSEELPFAIKLAPRTLRLSEQGMYRWLENRP